MITLDEVTILQNALRAHFTGHNLSVKLLEHSKELQISSDVFMMTIYKNYYSQVVYELKLLSNTVHAKRVIEEMQVASAIYYFLMGLGYDTIMKVLGES